MLARRRPLPEEGPRLSATRVEAEAKRRNLPNAFHRQLVDDIRPPTGDELMSKLGEEARSAILAASQASGVQEPQVAGMVIR